MGAMEFLGRFFRGDTIPDTEYAKDLDMPLPENDEADEVPPLNFGSGSAKTKPIKVVPFAPPPPMAVLPPQEPPVGDLLRSGSFGENTSGSGYGTRGAGGGGFGPGPGAADAADAYVIIKRVQDFQMASVVADRLIEGKIVILNLEDCDTEVARRVMDFVGGVAYGYSSLVRRISGRVFMITPKGVNSDGEFFDENPGINTEIRYDD